MLEFVRTFKKESVAVYRVYVFLIKKNEEKEIKSRN